MFHQYLFSHLGIGAESKARPQQVFCYRADMRLGDWIWKREVSLPVSLVCGFPGDFTKVNEQKQWGEGGICLILWRWGPRGSRVSADDLP